MDAAHRLVAALGDFVVQRIHCLAVRNLTANADAPSRNVQLRPRIRRPVHGGAIGHVQTAEPIACTGRISALIYQGGYIDIHIETPAAAEGKVLMRFSGHGSMTKWQVGETVGIAIDGTDAVAFAASG